VAEPVRKGFGTMLLESIVARRQGSNASMVFDPRGLRASLRLGLDPSASEAKSLV
jgi:two-component sensor histidine kinase